MPELRRLDLAPAQAGPALSALAEWVHPASALHPGDIGWALRFEDTITHLWLAGDTPVAVGLPDDEVYRVSLAPGFDGAELAPHIGDVCDGIDALADHGWSWDGEPWLHLRKPLTPAPGEFADLALEDVPDRVAVQRSAFEKSTFTVGRWQTMRNSPAGDSCVEVLIRTPAGEPASAVTGWLAGPGRCALIEPMGTHPAHRGHGYGRQALAAIGNLLASRGASAMAVLTPSTNTAAVALYQSAGFTVTGERRDLRRSQPA